jgi:hypothetical protein
MQYDQIIRQSVKAFKEGRLPEQISSRKEEGLKYTPEYFDRLEEDLLGETDKVKEDSDEADV